MGFGGAGGVGAATGHGGPGSGTSSGPSAGAGEGGAIGGPAGGGNDGGGFGGVAGNLGGAQTSAAAAAQAAAAGVGGGGGNSAGANIDPTTPEQQEPDVVDALSAAVPDMPDVTAINENTGPMGLPESAVQSKNAQPDQSTVSTALDALSQAMPAFPTPSAMRDMARVTGRAITSTIEGVTGTQAGPVSDGFAGGNPNGGGEAPELPGRKPRQNIAAKLAEKPDKSDKPESDPVDVPTRPVGLSSGTPRIREDRATQAIAGLSLAGALAYFVGR